MNLNNFEEEIDSVIVARGRDYFDDNNVDDLEKVSPSCWEAQVAGTDFYDVSIKFEDNEIVDWDCDCPYDWGPVCKHVVAVLYAIRREKTNTTSKLKTIGNTRSRKKSKASQLEEILQQTSKKDLQEFIQHYAAKDKLFLNQFIANFAELLDVDLKLKYKQIIKNIALAGMDRHGFIDYSSSFKVMNPISEILRKAGVLLEKRDFRESVAICQAVIEEVPLIIHNMDDSSGEAGYAFEQAFEIFNENVSRIKPPEFRDELFEYCLGEYPKQKYADFGFESHFLNILPMLVNDPEKEKRCLALLDQQLIKYQQEGYHYIIVEILLNKMRLYEHIGKTDEARKVVEANIEYSEFRKILVDEALENKDYETAIKLVNQGLKIVEEDRYQGVIKDWQVYLLEIAERMKATVNIRKWAQKLFFLTWDFSYYRRLKKTYRQDEWENEVESLIKRIDGGSNFRDYDAALIIARIFVEEEYYHRLLEILKLYAQSLNFIDEFSRHLIDKYPVEILKIYRIAVSKLSTYTGRSYYNEVAKFMKKMQKMKGGRSVVKEMLQEFRIRYKNRPAMMEVLSKNFKETK